jgi:hypothetical protein
MASEIRVYLVDVNVFHSDRYEGSRVVEERAYSAEDAVTQVRTRGNGGGTLRTDVRGVRPKEPEPSGCQCSVCVDGGLGSKR